MLTGSPKTLIFKTYMDRKAFIKVREITFSFDQLVSHSLVYRIFTLDFSITT